MQLFVQIEKEGVNPAIHVKLVLQRRTFAFDLRALASRCSSSLVAGHEDPEDAALGSADCFVLSMDRKMLQPESLSFACTSRGGFSTPWSRQRN